VFADKSFAQPIPLWIGMLTPFLPLMTSMIGAYLLISEHTVPPNCVFAVAPFLHLWRVPSLRQRSAEILCIAATQNRESQLFG
jgi:hypothetical protein